MRCKLAITSSRERITRGLATFHFFYHSWRAMMKLLTRIPFGKRGENMIGKRAALFVPVILIACGAFAWQRQQGSADEVIALERGALDRWAKGDPQGFLSIYSDEIT